MSLTWNELRQPAYVLAFLEGFLMLATPTGGAFHFVANGSAAQALVNGPNMWTLMGAITLGFLNGIRRVQSLATIPPTFAVIPPIALKPSLV
jgi:hypothetical protein